MDNKSDKRRDICDALIVASFGTVSEESRRLDIAPVEQAIADAAGNTWSIRRCFTSRMIIDIIAKKEGTGTDNIEEAVEKALQDGARRLAVQPTHLMKGLEYEKLKAALAGYDDSFERISIGDPLLSSERDISETADALIGASAEYEGEETALVFMGHGTDAASNSVYAGMQRSLRCKGRDDCYIGTVEAEPSLDDVIAAVTGGSYTKVVIRPLMLVAGSHAINDMASPDDPGSWYSRFTAEGYDTVCIREGLGRLPAIQKIYASHAKRVTG